MINLEIAKMITEACKKKSQEIGVPMVISIMDSGANLILCERMDGAIIAGIRISQDKAYTSAATGFGTHEIAGIAQPGQVAYGLANADGGRMIIFAGGIPIKQDGKLIGSIGVSGGLANQDHEAAEAGLNAFMKSAK